ncbi:MAG TPA: HAD hydrolase family protein [Acidimicrobiales bacterium]|nr:HAD hydrolase family protein [Acidimicrobiales bacterium]
MLEEVRRLGLECQLIRNRSELMVLPSGVSKGSGLLEALGELGLSRHNTVAVGDAENDHSLLEVTEVGVAVANAVPSLKAQADVVLDRPDGAGIVGLFASELLAGRERIHPRGWQVTLGVDDGRRAVRLPGSQINLLIAGGTGDGKSYLAGLVAEQLVGLGYSLLVIDPEGDYVGLGQRLGVVVVVLRHHCSRRDFSRWVRGAFHHDQLAEAVLTAEARVRPGCPAAVIDAVRLELIAALQARHTRAPVADGGAEHPGRVRGQPHPTATHELRRPVAGPADTERRSHDD